MDMDLQCTMILIISLLITAAPLAQEVSIVMPLHRRTLMTTDTTAILPTILRRRRTRPTRGTLATLQEVTTINTRLIQNTVILVLMKKKMESVTEKVVRMPLHQATRGARRTLLACCCPRPLPRLTLM
jgi:hypothetical protein